jgi:pimeloyl-ACP methyl ester carboxylesterase
MNTVNDKKDIQEKPAGRRRSCLGCLGRGTIGLAIFLVVAMLAGSIYQAAASASDLKKYPPPGELYDVGDYRLHLYCTGDDSLAGATGDDSLAGATGDDSLASATGDDSLASATGDDSFAGATGEGSPTVILEAGAGSPSIGWYLVQREVGGFTRVCSYDRPGFGWSDPPTSPLSREQVATLLHQLLKTANVPEPYILVGHSAGGEYIRAYARQYPSEVLGMVFVDSSHESQTLRYPAKFLAFSQNQLLSLKLCQLLSPFGVIRLTRLWDSLIPESLASTDLGEAVMSTMYRSEYCKAAYGEEVTFGSPGEPGEPGSLGNLPLIVLSAGALYDAMPESIVTAMGGPDMLTQVVQVHDELQQELVSLSTAGRLIIAENSGHEIHWYQHELVIDAIRTLVEQVHGE